MAGAAMQPDDEQRRGRLRRSRLSTKTNEIRPGEAAEPGQAETQKLSTADWTSTTGSGRIAKSQE